MMKEVRLLLILCGLFCGTAVAQPRLSTPPNMIVILADDLGYGGFGLYRFQADKNAFP